jgi:hypothetical protein
MANQSREWINRHATNKQHGYRGVFRKKKTSKTSD